MSTTTDRNGAMIKFMVSNEGNKTEASVECRIQEEQARKDKINDKEFIRKYTLERMISKYKTEIGGRRMGEGGETARKKNKYLGAERGKESKRKWGRYIIIMCVIWAGRKQS